jgi:hypothetical protein
MEINQNRMEGRLRSLLLNEMLSRPENLSPARCVSIYRKFAQGKKLTLLERDFISTAFADLLEFSIGDNTNYVRYRNFRRKQ